MRNHIHQEAKWIDGRVYCLCGEEMGGYAQPKELTIKTTGGEVKAIEYADGSITYPDHDPFCVIYKLGVEHCNCAESEVLED